MVATAFPTLAVLLCSLAGTVVIVSASEAPSPTTLPAIGRRTVEVFGTGTADAPVDRFAVEITVATGAVKPAHADAAADEVMARLHEALRAAGADPTALEPDMPPTTSPAVLIPAGEGSDDIILRRHLRLPSASMAAARAVVNALGPLVAPLDFPAKPGLRSVRARSRSTQFEKDPAKFVESATRAAIANARQEAAATARAGDLKCGPLISIGRIEKRSLDGDESATKGVVVSGVFVFEMTE